MPDPVRRIDRLGPDDLEALQGLAELLDEPLDDRAARAYLSAAENVVLAAYDGDRPVGFLRGTALLQLHTRRPQMFLYEIAVAADRRRSGIGRSLIEALLDYCRSRGFDEAFVFTDDPENEAAHRLYDATGGVTETAGERMYVYRFPEDGAGGPDRSRGTVRRRRSARTAREHRRRPRRSERPRNASISTEP